MKQSETMFSQDSDMETKKSYEDIKAEKKALLARKQFRTIGKYDMPFIKKQNIDPDTIDLLSYTKIKSDETENNYKTIHFFTYDWLFDTVYNKPEKAFEELQQYYAVLTPDFSVYTDMPLIIQMYSIFKNRWCGAYWQREGMKVIPTVQWGDERSFEFCFDGIEEGSVVAVSTYCREEYKEGWMLGYNKMLEVIKPKAVICYGDAFPGMKGNVKVIPAINHKELVAKLGTDEYAKRFFEGVVYPS